MSLLPTIVNYRQLMGQIYFIPEQMAFIRSMPELKGNEWKGDNLDKAVWSHGDGVKVKRLVRYISKALEELQGNYCIYCGMLFGVTSGKEVEHIAPKGDGRYPQFMFTALNLVLACSLCNGFEKKERKVPRNYWDTIAGPAEHDYRDCEFTIVHPYFDDPDIHFDFVHVAGNDPKVVIEGLTAKGLCSISTFKLDEEPLTTERVKHVEIWAKRQNPHIEKLIEETLLATLNI